MRLHLEYQEHFDSTIGVHPTAAEVLSFSPYTRALYITLPSTNPPRSPPETVLALYLGAPQSRADDLRKPNEQEFCTMRTRVPDPEPSKVAA